MLMDDCAGNNFRRSSQSSPNGLRQMMNNKPERPVFTDNGIFYDAARPEVINKLITYLLRMDAEDVQATKLLQHW